MYHSSLSCSRLPHIFFSCLIVPRSHTISPFWVRALSSCLFACCFANRFFPSCFATLSPSCNLRNTLLWWLWVLDLAPINLLMSVCRGRLLSSDSCVLSIRAGSVLRCSSLSSHNSGMLISSPLNARYGVPRLGLFNTSAHMRLAGQCSTSTTPLVYYLSNLSMCFVLPPARTLAASLIAHLLAA